MYKKIVILLLIMLMLLIGCAKNNDEQQLNIEADITNEPNVETDKSITMDDIKGFYNDNDELKMKLINNKYVLAQSIGTSGALYFELYNLENGTKDIIHNNGTYSQLDRIVNENYIVLRSSGISTETSIGIFPFEIHCLRIEDDSESVYDYMVIEKEIDHLLRENVESGSKKTSYLHDGIITYNGLQLKFTPIEGKEQQFNAAASDIPPTKIHFNEQENTIYIDIIVEKYNNELIGNLNISKCEYIDSINLIEIENGIRLEVLVNLDVKTYRVNKIYIDTGIGFNIGFQN